MMSTWTNPSLALHTDMLRAQYRIFHQVRDRMKREGRIMEAIKLGSELIILHVTIKGRERGRL